MQVWMVAMTPPDLPSWIDDAERLARSATLEVTHPHHRMHKQWRNYVAALSPERVLALIACIESLSDDAAEPCTYGDNCPSFVRLNHYRCRPCKSRVARAALADAGGRG